MLGGPFTREERIELISLPDEAIDKVSSIYNDGMTIATVCVFWAPMYPASLKYAIVGVILLDIVNWCDLTFRTVKNR